MTRIDANEMNKKIVYREESYRIIGACFEVHNEKGAGFLEAVYQECLAIEFAASAIPYQQKKDIRLQYKGQVLKQFYQPDFFCFEKIVVEIKALKQLNDEHRAQIINCLKSTGVKLGLLINFGHHPRLEYERFANEQ